MEILRLLEQADWAAGYEIQEYRRWADGFYRKLRITLTDTSVLFAREYVDASERNYSFHWQTAQGALIARWDNAPHHKHITTFPHHKHLSSGEAVENKSISLQEVLEFIGNSEFKE